MAAGSSAPRNKVASLIWLRLRRRATRTEAAAARHASLGRRRLADRNFEDTPIAIVLPLGAYMFAAAQTNQATN